MGTGASSSPANFNTLLLEVNPGLTLAGYPEEWTEYTANVTGYPEVRIARTAFRHVVPNVSEYGNYVGIDTLTIDFSPVPEPGSAMLLAVPLVAGLFLRRRLQARRMR